MPHCTRRSCLLPGLIPVILQDQLQCLEEIGLGLLDGFSFRKDIGEFFKATGEPAFESRFEHGSEIQFIRRWHAGMMLPNQARLKLKL